MHSIARLGKPSEKVVDTREWRLTQRAEPIRPRLQDLGNSKTENLKGVSQALPNREN
jgi:hypothetical protein